PRLRCCQAKGKAEEAPVTRSSLSSQSEDGEGNRRASARWWRGSVAPENPSTIESPFNGPPPHRFAIGRSDVFPLRILRRHRLVRGEGTPAQGNRHRRSTRRSGAAVDPAGTRLVARGGARMAAAARGPRADPVRLRFQ